MLLYCTSFDQYGPGAAPAYKVDDSHMGWDFGNANGGANDWTIIGDAFAAQPSVGTSTPVVPVGSYGIAAPAWGARRGNYAFYADSVNVNQSALAGGFYTSGSESLRLAIPGASQMVRMIHAAFSVDNLPALDYNHGMLMDFQDAFGNSRGRLGVNPSGRLVLYDGTPWHVDTSVLAHPTVLAVSTSPVIDPGSWVSLNIQITANAANANVDVAVYVGDVTAANLVMNVTGVAFTAGAQKEIDIVGFLPASISSNYSTDVQDATTRWVRDVVVFDTTGTYNNSLPGQVFVAAQDMRDEDAGGGWTARYREHIGVGILDHVTASTGVYVPDSAILEVGAGDFCIEGFFRIRSLPAAGTAVFMSKWEADTLNKSWKLIWNQPTGEIQFIISTDGTAETVLFKYPWTPDVDTWYHVAADRAAGVFRLFVAGTQLGVDTADANVYFDGVGDLGLLSEWNSAHALVASTLQAYADEVRVTVGASRYTADFTPTSTKFGRNAVDDPSYASVALLMGFDDAGIVDESSHAFAVTAGAGVAPAQPADSGHSYEALNRRPAWDDTYIEAAETFATTILTLTALPTASETVTLGAVTYTYVAAPAAANDVAVGATVADSLSNLIAAVNAGAGSGTAYGAGTVANADVFAASLPNPQALFTATAIGAPGNSVASTETLAAGAFSSGLTLSGGADIPAPSDFAMERLPVDVTGVLGLQVSARGYKSNAGSAQVRLDLKGPAAAVVAGTAQATDLTPSWMRQIFEQDPDTSAAITPSTITGGRVRVTRTA